MDTSLVSIIIRTKNEEAWIGRCLDAIKEQTYGNHEIILVDTGSTDNTLEILKNYDVNLIIYDEKYIPGKALNSGCREAKGEYLVFISAHCLPVNEFWLENLVKDISDPYIAGIYGKQEPMSSTNPFDKRDLILTFGLDRKVQWKDNFFHNANSIIKIKLWKQLPFDETLSNIEDRIWAANMQKFGYCIVYEPTARVFHHHGIHQNGCKIRCDGVNKIIDNLEQYVDENSLEKRKVTKCNIDAIIPFSKSIDLCKDISMYEKNLENTINDFKGIKYIRNIYLLTDSEILIKYARERYPEIIIPYIRVNDSNETVLGILEDFIDKVEFEDSSSFLVAYINNLDTYTCRRNLFQKLCRQYIYTNHSAAIYVKENTGAFFRKAQDLFFRLDEQLGRYRGYKTPLYEVVEDNGYIVHINNIKSGFKYQQDTLILEKSGVNA